MGEREESERESEKERERERERERENEITSKRKRKRDKYRKIVRLCRLISDTYTLQLVTSLHSIALDTSQF
mgnify:CR=1 FL=1